MTEFDDRTRAQAEVVVARHLAEVEAARRVIAAIDGEDYSSLEGEADSLRRELSAEVERSDAITRQLQTLSADNHQLMVARQLDVGTLSNLREANADLRAALADAQRRLERADQRVGRRQAEVTRLKSALGEAQAEIAQLKSAGKAEERGVHKSPREVNLSADARAVLGCIERVAHVGQTFTVAQLVLAGGSIGRLTTTRIRAALAELEDIAVTKRPPKTKGSATRYERLQTVRAAKRRSPR